MKEDIELLTKELGIRRVLILYEQEELKGDAGTV